MIGNSHVEPFSSFGESMGGFGSSLGDFFSDFGDDFEFSFHESPQLAVPLTILSIFGRLFFLGLFLFVVIFFVSRHRARHRTFEGE